MVFTRDAGRDLKRGMNILTLAFTPEVETRLTTLRVLHFPPERNYLDAHVTLFHALPPATRSLWSADLQSAVESTSVFNLRFTAPYSLGAGVAIRVDCPPLVSFRENLRTRWAAMLLRQDSQPYRPHCTIQNKVDVSEARDLLRELKDSWTPIDANAHGVRLWTYLGGPWKFEEEFRFRE